jgi:predicted O-methyltransferase YrrM
MRIQGIKSEPSRGSHLPVLMKLVQMTSGPILELGYGMYSTHYLHWACYPTQRTLVTYESHPSWIDFAKQFHQENHTVHCVENWDEIDLSPPWSIAFVDHIEERRALEARKLVHADYVVVHDSDGSIDRKRQNRVLALRSVFKYHTQYCGPRPHTAIFSNVHDLTEFRIP